MTEKQRRFADEYLIDLNATRAYKAAYPSVKHDDSAASSAYKLLRNTQISAYIEARKKELQDHARVSQERIVEELAAIAFSDMCEIVSVEGGVFCCQDTDALEPAQRKTIAMIKPGEFGVEIKFHDKLKALEMLCKLLGFGKDKLDRKEQKARIAKLRSETRAEESGDSGVTVRFVGMEDAAE